MTLDIHTQSTGQTIFALFTLLIPWAFTIFLMRKVERLEDKIRRARSGFSVDE